MTKTRGSRDPRRRAREVLAECGITRAPIPVKEIAEKKGITVRFMPLEDELSGMIFVKDTVPIIVVNSLQHPNRQRFTLAHECGHFELHMGDIGSEVHVDKKLFVLARDASSSKGFDRKEIEANRFAAELLVPKDFLVAELRGRVIDVEDVFLMGELARTFDVSSQMMSIRIGELFERQK
jgi:Zn-dependent peptidase ImmA (M78 family)